MILRWEESGLQAVVVAVPDRLKVEIRVATTRAQGIQISQKGAVDTRNRLVPGVVSRIEPALQEGLINVDIKLTNELPRGQGEPL